MKFDVFGHASMVGANAMWGMMSPISKYLLIGGFVTPLVITDLRIGGAMVLFWLLSLFTKKESVPAKDLVKLFFASLFAIVLNQGSFIIGVNLTSPSDASIITTSMPLWAMVLSAFILKEAITGLKLLGIGFGAAGALTLILNSANGVQTSNSDTAIYGDLLVLFAQFSYALYMVLYKNFVSRYSLVTIMKWMFTFAFICTMPFSFQDFVDTTWTDLGLLETGGLFFIVFFATFVSYILCIVGLKRLSPTITGMYNYVQPIVACIVAILWNMDTFSVTKLLAIIMIFTGVYLVTISKSKVEMTNVEE